METLTITVPATLAEELHTANQEFLVNILVRGLHTKNRTGAPAVCPGGISLAAAASKAGVSQSEFSRHAYAHGMEPLFSAQTLAEDLGKPHAIDVVRCWSTDGIEQTQSPGPASRPLWYGSSTARSV